jgi:hypothetical protein
MKVTATTHAQWYDICLGISFFSMPYIQILIYTLISPFARRYGAPPGLFCAPRTEFSHTGTFMRTEILVLNNRQ